MLSALIDRSRVRAGVQCDEKRPRTAFLLRLGRDRGGGAALEFAVIGPVSLTLIAGIVELGLLLFTQAALDDASFAACGVSRQKRDYLRGLASTALEAPDRFTRLEPLADEAAIAELTVLKGVGRWTAEMYLLFALGRLDILPLGDLSIRAAIAELYELPAAAPPAAVAAVAEAWRPYRSVACWYLYAHLERRRKPR